MGRADDQLTEQFYRWELRGRGWKTFGAPVALEPPFRPFFGHFLPPSPAIDDGRTHTAVSGFLERLKPRPAAPPPQPLPLEIEPEPEWRNPETIVELQLTLPVSRSPSPQQIENLIRQISRGGDPIALEILGTKEEIVPQFVATPKAAMRIHRTLQANFPSIVFTPSADALTEAWCKNDAYFAVAELGLGMEFMLPFGDPRSDLLGGVVTALDALAEEELGLFQIQFEPVWNDWTESIITSVTDREGGPIFVNRPELVRAGQQKISSPLFSVVLRLAACAEEVNRCWEIIADMAAGFSALSRPGTNYLVPLFNDEYPANEHEEDILNRQCRRSGMLLNLEELSHFLALPTAAVSRRLRRDTVKSRPAPELPAHAGSLLLGDNRHAGITREVRLSPEQRVRHMHLIGASGTGKSTLLFNLIRQDVESGQGLAIFDPHGDLVDKVLGIIPPERVSDVVLIDPSDEQFSVGFNILAAHSDFEKNLLASDLVSVFQRLSTSWGDQMNSVLRNAILAFLESTEGGTLADLRRFLLDPAYRNRFLSTVTDPEVVFYWKKAFPQLTGNKSVGPVVTRLDEFLSRKPIRYMVSQKENRVNFSEVLDKGRILLAKLSQGEIGRENSYLLGSLLLSKIQQAAMSRQRMRESERRDFWCYVDEFHCFITPSMAEILTGARKYRVGLILAHQELRQLQTNTEVSGAVLANAFTRVVFRVGDADARSLESGLSHFEARDLQNLEIGQAVCRIERSDFDFNLSIRPPDAPNLLEDQQREKVIALSRAKYARARGEIEAELLRKWQQEESPDSSPKKTPAPPEPSPPPAVSESAQPVPKVEEAPEVSKGSQKKTDSPIQEEPPAPSPALRETPELGKGGVQHHAIQQRLQAAGQEAGFQVAVEKEVLDGHRSIDLVFKKGGVSIACEINVTSTIDYEVGNVTKCLKAEFPHVAVICPRPDRLARLEEAVKGCLAPEQSAKVSFFSPDGFATFLQNLSQGSPPAETSSTPTATVRRGYKVKRHVVEISEEDAKAREQAAIKMIAEKLRRTESGSA